jgi:DNA-binding response OmpR family regulator
MAKILIVEDDKEFAKTVSDWLALDHHSIETSFTGGDGLNRVKTYSYDLIVLDMNLPEVPGLQILKEFRNMGGSTPVLILTGQGDIADKEAGLDTGADDYLTKPFQGRELTARVRALLRRPRDFSGTSLQQANMVLDSDKHCVIRNGEEISLVPSEFALLEFFMRHPDKVFSAETLLNRVWRDDSEATTDAVTTCVKRLRKKLDQADGPSVIRTIFRVGYKLETRSDEQGGKD